MTKNAAHAPSDLVAGQPAAANAQSDGSGSHLTAIVLLKIAPPKKKKPRTNGGMEETGHALAGSEVGSDCIELSFDLDPLCHCAVSRYRQDDVALPQLRIRIRTSVSACNN